MAATASEIEALPKVELHCHLDGIVDPPLLRELQRRGITLPLTPEALAAAYPVTDFASFVRWFEAGHPLAGALASYQPIIAQHIERLRAQRVVYAEIMVASGELPLDPAAAVDALQAFRAWVDKCEGGAIQVEFLVAFGRNKSPERIERIADRNLRLHDAGLICGVALAGPEQGYPVQPLARTFARYYEAGVPIEIHAAEWCGPESAWDALAYGFPRRLGHGTHAFADPRLVDEVAARALHVEMCPTSNLCTGSIARIEEHPIARAVERGLSVGVNTDDPGAFGCSMASEHALLARVFGFDVATLRQLSRNALAARFQPILRGLVRAFAEAPYS
jgi:adenosine deaminase